MTTIYSKAGTDAAISAATGALTPEDVGADPAGTAAAAIAALGLGTAAQSDATDFAPASSAAYPVQQVTLTGSLAYTLPVDAPADQVIPVIFTQDGTGGHAVTYGGNAVAVDLTTGESTEVEFWPVGAGHAIRYPVTNLDAQVSALAEDGGSALGASLSSTYVAQGAVGGLLAPPLSNVTAEAAGTTPIALDVWGGYLWGAYGTGIYRSDDEGETWELYATAAAASILRIMPTSDGEVVVCDAAAVRKSSGWAGGSPTWATKVAANGTCQFQSWGFDGDAAGTKFIATDYSSTRADSRYVNMSLDSGDTWAVVYDSVTVHGATLADASHMHGVCYDEWGDRWYISEGHDDGGTVGDIAGIYCSEDDGATWSRASGMEEDPSPTVLVATADGLVCGSDSTDAGLFGVQRRTDPADEELVQTWRWQTGHTAATIGFGKRGYRQPGTGQVYVSFVTHYADVAPVIAAGTPTSGALVYTWPGSFAANDFIAWPVMPSTGRLVAYGYMDSGATRYIITARPGLPGSLSVSIADTGGVLGGSGGGDSVAAGPRSTTGTAIRAVAVGVGADASVTQDGTAVGFDATAGIEGTAVGAGAISYSYGVAIGKGSNTGAYTEGVAIGAGAVNTSSAATALGRNATAGNASTAVGMGANASGVGAVALGFGATSTHTRSVSLRDATTANYQIQCGARHLELKEVASAPGVAPADSVRLYARDNGSGKTQLVCIFPSGAVQVIATEP